PPPGARTAAAEKVRAKNIRRYTLLEAGAGFNSELFGYARSLLRNAEEREKENNVRLREYADANQETLKKQLTAEEEIYDAFEIAKLSDSLTFLCGELGEKDPL